MEDSGLCGVCNTLPKKYKCPTCTLPYCSIPCFKLHKPTHTTHTPTPAPITSKPDLPCPPAPAPPPRYLQNKTDFSLIATNPDLKELLKQYPNLLPTLQRVYAKTIEPEPDGERRSQGGRGGYRGRGFGGRGRGRGRGRGGWHGNRGIEESRWTEKKGDNDAMKLLKRIREGDEDAEETEGLGEFVRLVQEVFREDGDAMGTQ